jgi:rubrerythrin
MDRTSDKTTHSRELGFKDYPRFLSNLKRAIHDQAGAVRFYEELEKAAPREDKDFINHALEDEKTHVQMFRKLYNRLTGKDVFAHAAKTEFPSYKDGIEIAFRRELEAAELYRDMYLSTKIPKVRDILFKAMTDEMEHAQRFSFLYNRPESNVSI